MRLQLALQKAKELLHAREPMAKGAVGCRPRVAHLRSRIEEPLAGPSWLAPRINGQRREDRNGALPLLALLANELDRAPVVA